MLYTCPHCQGEVEADPAAEEELVCPHCAGHFVVTKGTDDGEAEAADEPPPEREALDALRIRRISLIKRTLLRRRSLLVAGAVVGGMGAAQLLWSAMRDMMAHGPRPQGIGFIVVAVVLLVGAALLLRAARRVRRQLDEKPPETDLPQPDFTPLSDGSQHWKNLENIK